jgi:anti-anti-sigma factor
MLWIALDRCRPDLSPGTRCRRKSRSAARSRPSATRSGCTAPVLDAHLRELRDSGFRRLILDLRGLLFIDSSGLHLIIRYDAEARRDGFALELVPGDRAVQVVFEVSGVAARLPFVDA